MSDYGTQTPHIASYLIVRKRDKIAFVLRDNTSWMNNFYGLPSGKVEKEESFIQAAIREAKEEIGIEVNADNLKHVLTMHRREGMDWVDIYFEVSDYEGEVVNAEPHMHSELAWFSPDNLPQNTIPSVVAALADIQKGLHYSQYGWNATL